MKVFAFFLTSPGGQRRLVFARGVTLTDAKAKLNEFQRMTGETSLLAANGQPVDMAYVQGSTGAPLIEQVGGQVREVGAASGAVNPFMTHYFAGTPLTIANLRGMQGSNTFTGMEGLPVTEEVDPNAIDKPIGGFDPPPPPEPEAETRNVDDPYLPEGSGSRYAAQAAWARALDAIGMGGGIPGAIASSRFTPLQNIASIGAAGGLFNNPSYPLFQGLGEGRELQDFFQTALPGVGGRNFGVGVHPLNLAEKAKQLFSFQNPTEELRMIYNPALGVAAGTPGQTLENVSGDAAAKMIAQLGLTGYGRGRFGALGGFLPSAERLVADYAAQPVGSATQDIREYIKNRLSAVSQ